VIKVKHEIGRNSVLRKLVRLGNSLALSLPSKWVEGWDFVVIERRAGELVVRPVSLQVIEE